MFTPFIIGSTVNVTLYNKGVGIVTAIHGKQSPETVRVIGPMSTGGTAFIDIIFNDGSAFMNVAECIAHTYERMDSFCLATHEEVKVAIARYEAKKETDRVAQIDEKTKFNAEVEAIKNSEEYKHLKPENKVAQNIRADLKKHFKGVKFSVITRGYDSVSVKYTDGPTRKEVEAVLAKWESGFFDGMSDSYQFVRTAFGEVFNTIRYVFVERDNSNETISEVIGNYNAQYGTSYTITEYNSGNLQYEVTRVIRNILWNN